MLRWFETETYLEGVNRLAALNAQIEALSAQASKLYFGLFDMCEAARAENHKQRPMPLTLFGVTNDRGVRCPPGFKWAFMGDNYNIVIDLVVRVWSPEPHLGVQVEIGDEVETRWVHTLTAAEEFILSLLSSPASVTTLIATTPEV